jgi:hypothetical protein
MKNKRFWNVVKVAFLLPALFAVMDVVGAKLWAKIGGWESSAYVTAGHIYQYAFWSMAYVAVAGIALTYYLIRKDKSESLALLLIPVILLQCGVEDIIFYWFSGLNASIATMPWLMNNLWPPTIISNILGQPVITGTILYFTAFAGIIGSYYLAKKLEQVKG